MFFEEIKLHKKLIKHVVSEVPAQFRIHKICMTASKQYNFYVGFHLECSLALIFCEVR